MAVVFKSNALPNHNSAIELRYHILKRLDQFASNLNKSWSIFKLTTSEANYDQMKQAENLEKELLPFFQTISMSITFFYNAIVDTTMPSAIVAKPIPQPTFLDIPDSLLNLNSQENWVVGFKLISLNIFASLNFCKVEFPTYWNVINSLVDMLHLELNHLKKNHSYLHSKSLFICNRISGDQLQYIFDRSLSSKQTNVSIEDKIQFSTIFFWFGVLEKIVDVIEEELLKTNIIPFISK